MPHGSLRSIRSTLSWEVFRLRGLPPMSGMRTWDELGVGRGVPEGLRLGPGRRDESSERSWAEAAIGGKEGEKNEGGGLREEGGMRW